MLLGDDALHDLGSFTNAGAEVIQLSPANLAVTYYFDSADTGAVIGESALYAYAVGYAANGEGLADTAALHFNHDAFEVLKTFAVAFHDLNEYADGVTDFQLGQVGTELFFFPLFDDVGPFYSPSYGCSYTTFRRHWTNRCHKRKYYNTASVLLQGLYACLS